MLLIKMDDDDDGIVLYVFGIDESLRWANMVRGKIGRITVECALL